MEAFPFEEADYKLLDDVLLDIIGESSGFITDQPLWDFYENHITPPSEVIKRNKVTLYIKTIRRTKGLTHQLHLSFPNNFLVREISYIENTWGCVIQEVINNYKGTKLVPKREVKSLHLTYLDLRLEKALNQSSWNVYQEKQFPAPVPLELHSPPPKYLRIRYNLIFPQTPRLCRFCNILTANKILHRVYECQHPLCVLTRTQVFRSIKNSFPSLADFLQSCSSMVGARVMTGLQLVNSAEAMSLMREVTQSKLCTLDED